MNGDEVEGYLCDDRLVKKNSVVEEVRLQPNFLLEKNWIG